IRYVAIQSNSPLTRDAVQPLNQVGEAAFVLAVNILGEVNLPAQTVVEGKLRRYAPRVLAVVEHAVLALCRIQSSAHVTADLSHLAQHKGGPVQAANTSVRGRTKVERV